MSALKLVAGYVLAFAEAVFCTAGIAAWVLVGAMLIAPRHAHAAEVTDPSVFSSLQPFRKFGKGEGYGFAREYKPRSKADFVGLLRDRDRAHREMRVGCETLVRQMAEVHNLPLEGCEGAAAEIERNDGYSVVACEDQMFEADNWLAVTDARGTSWGVWHRSCLAHEQVLTYKGRTIASTTCLNVAVPVVPLRRPAPAAAAVPQPFATSPAPLRKPGNCTGQYTFIVNVWDKNKIPPELLQEAEAHMKAAKVRDTRAATHHPGYATDAFSRTVGPKIRALEEKRIKEAHQAAAAASAPFVLPPSMRAQGSWVIGLYFRDPKSEQLLEGGRVKVQTMIQVTNGLGEIDFTEAEVANIIETTYPDSFLSPEKSGEERRIIVFPYGHSLRSEWWEYEEGTRNKVRSCRYHVHALIAGS